MQRKARETRKTVQEPWRVDTGHRGLLRDAPAGGVEKSLLETLNWDPLRGFEKPR